MSTSFTNTTASNVTAGEKATFRANIGAASEEQGSLADTALQPTVATKTTPVDADTVEIQDSADSGARKLLTFANLWVWIKSKLDTVLTIAGAKTWSGQQELTGQTATNGTSAINRTLLKQQVRLLAGALPDSDVIDNADNYTTMKELGTLAGRCAPVSGVADSILGGWIQVHNDSGLYYLSTSGPSLSEPTTVGVSAGYSIQGPAPTNYGMFLGMSGNRSTVAFRHLLPDLYNDGGVCFVGRERFFGIGTLSNGPSAVLTKETGTYGAGIGYNNTSDYIQYWDGTSWADTSLRWKSGGALYPSTYAEVMDFQMVAQDSELKFYGRNTDGGNTTWTLLGTKSWPYNEKNSVVIASSVSATTSRALSLQIKKLHYAINR